MLPFPPPIWSLCTYKLICGLYNEAPPPLGRYLGKEEGWYWKGEAVFPLCLYPFPPLLVWSSNQSLWLGTAAALEHLGVPISGLVHVALRRKCLWLSFQRLPPLSDHQRIAFWEKRCRKALWAERLWLVTGSQYLCSMWLGVMSACNTDMV